jgi:hypothetical protein
MVEIKKRLRASYAACAICLVIAIGSFPYDLWLKYQEERKLTPVLALNAIIKGLKAHYDQHRTFPQGFHQLDNQIWRRPRLYYADGSEMQMAHYYYSYYLVRSDFCTIWAFPRGGRKDKADTVYLELTPKGYQTWRGKVPTDQVAQTAPPVPSRQFLGSLEMAEEPHKEFKNKDKKRRSR